MDSYHRLKLSTLKLDFSEIKDIQQSVDSPQLDKMDNHRTPSFDQFCHSFNVKDFSEVETPKLTKKNSQVFTHWIENPQIFKGKFKSGMTPIKQIREISPDFTLKNLKQPSDFQLKFQENITQNQQKKQFETPQQAIYESPRKRKLSDASYQSPPKRKKSEQYTKGLLQTPKIKNQGGGFIGHMQTNNFKSNKNEENPMFSRFDQDFEIIRCIGSGSFGKVYECLNKFDKSHYAVKCTHNPFQCSSIKNQSLNEATALAQLSSKFENPHIVRYFNAWVQDDYLYIVMELCKQSLESTQQIEQVFSEKQIYKLLSDLLIGLDQLHSRSIVHLDIKPENCLLSQGDVYKIADLGLTRMSIRTSGENIIEGDCHYMAPELLKEYTIGDGPIPDLTKADIFSLGISIYQLMINEKLPPNGDEWLSIRNDNLYKLDQLTQYSPNLINLIRAMMSSDPSKRPSARQILDEEIFQNETQKVKQLQAENQQLKQKIQLLEQQLQKYQQQLNIQQSIQQL